MEAKEKPTYEELEELIAHLLSRLAELERQQNKDSRNSSKPPSTDGYKKPPAPKNMRKPTDKKSGGQKGHEGTTRNPSTNPDEIIDIYPDETICDCGGEVEVKKECYIQRDVIDIEPTKTKTTRYRLFEGACVICGKKHSGKFPKNVTSAVQFGARLKGIITYLNEYQLIPLGRTVELIGALYETQISQGSIVNTTTDACEKLAEFEEWAKEDLIQSEVVHFDETGMRKNGHLEWLHSASTKTTTLYGFHKNRGCEGIDKMGILPNFEGVAVHDHWKPYYKYSDCTHAECNAHILRTLIYLHEDLGYAWSKAMIELLLKIKYQVEITQVFEATEMSKEEIRIHEDAYHQILESAKIEEAGREATYTAKGKLKNSEGMKMAKRLDEYSIETLSFMYDFKIPFDNNQAERDLRMPKLKQKISGCFRTDKGSESFARIRSFIETCKKRKKSILEGLAASLQGDAVSFLTT